MRVKTLLAVFLSALGVAGIPWGVRGEPLADPRHQRRQKAAEILRDAINDDKTNAIAETVRRYETAVTQAVGVIGSSCRAANALKQALLQAKETRPIADAELKALRDRIGQICETLAFAPMMEAEMPKSGLSTTNYSAGWPATRPLRKADTLRFTLPEQAQRGGTSAPLRMLLRPHRPVPQVDRLASRFEVSFRAPHCGHLMAIMPPYWIA
jgi:hypothetical protein